MVYLKRSIEESDGFKEDHEFVKTVIEPVLEEIKTQNSKKNSQIELECLKLKRCKMIEVHLGTDDITRVATLKTGIKSRHLVPSDASIRQCWHENCLTERQESCDRPQVYDRMRRQEEHRIGTQSQRCVFIRYPISNQYGEDFGFVRFNVHHFFYTGALTQDTLSTRPVPLPLDYDGFQEDSIKENNCHRAIGPISTTAYCQACFQWCHSIRQRISRTRVEFFSAMSPLLSRGPITSEDVSEDIQGNGRIST
ncbi:hypothetical protein TNCV_3975391 [Trichonephila clavipes]|nr:hypothetical protein TNCV_3975391 [Trichonephila clavipes]